MDISDTDFDEQYSSDILQVIDFLRSNHMKQTELCLRREYHSHVNKMSLPTNNNRYIRDLANVSDYFMVYSCLLNFVLNSSYKIELIQCLFPLFVHLYLDLIEHNYIYECQCFYNKFVHSTVESLHLEFFYQLKLISKSSKHLYRCPLTNAFRTSRFFLRLSMTTCNELQNFVDSAKNSIHSDSPFHLTSAQLSLLLSMFQQYIKIDVNQQLFTPSNIVRYKTSEQPMTPIFVDVAVANSIQFTRLYTSIFSAPSTGQYISRPLNNVDLNSIPRLGPHKLPSICLFTLKYSKQQINCVTLSSDCQLVAIGFQTSEILICSLNPNDKLYAMKSAKQLQHLLSHSKKINTYESTLDKLSASMIPNERLLIGHTASIFALAFEPNKRLYLLSGSQDSTIRLWHLLTWSCLVVYKIHYQPILDVTFALNGQIFASCGADGFVSVWTIDKISPFRIYPEYGHSGPINLVEFHPNSNYLASAHNDHTIHLWAIQNENVLVRIFNGHRHHISALEFSPTGHFLASGCWNGEVILWDIQNNVQIAHLSLHKQAISSIEFSPMTGTLLLVSSIDSSISLWNSFMITKLYDEKLTDTLNANSTANKLLLNLFKTKNTPIFHIRFSKENILYAIGLNNCVNE